MQNEEVFKFYGKVTDIVEVNSKDINELSKYTESDFITKNYNQILSNFFLDEFILIIDRKDKGFGTYVHVINTEDRLKLRLTYNTFIKYGIKECEEIEVLKSTNHMIKRPSSKAIDMLRVAGLSDDEINERFNKSCDMYFRTVMFLNAVAILNINPNDNKSSELLSKTTQSVKKTNSKNKSKNNKSKSSSKVSLFKKYTINSGSLSNLNYSMKDFNYKVSSWGVSGHYRHYKNGTVKWIKPGTRHRRKGQAEQTGYAPKTYIAK